MDIATALFKITEHVLSIYDTKTSRKYVDRVIYLKKKYVRELSKDEEFIDLGLNAVKLGFKCFFVIEIPGELNTILEKIADGKMNKFFKDNTLMHQAFVKDNSKSVADYLKSVDADLKVTAFKRVALG